MSVHYHTGKMFLVEEFHSRLFMGCVAHVEQKRNELVKDVHRLSHLGVRIMIIEVSGVTV